VSLSNSSESLSTVRERRADDIANEYAAIATGAGIAALGNRTIVRVTGDDRVPFMHGMCSNDIKGLATRAVSPALILTEHAHIIGDFFVYAEDDALIFEIDRSLWAKTRDHLEKFLVADDVEFEELDVIGVIDVEGPMAARAVATVASDIALSLPLWHYTDAAGMRIANLPRCGASAFTIIVDQARVVSIIETVRDRAAAAGISAIAQVGAETLEIARVEHGVARVGVDTGDKTIALEARMEPAISYSKGCYLGQETIERATARGGLKKKLYGLRFESDRMPAVGCAIMLAGKEVGSLTSVVNSPRFGVIGLSILHHSAWRRGTGVTISDAGNEFAAITSELPFA
jgi:folate-binding protein YgfZ